MIVYIETSAFLKLLISEPQSEALRARFRDLRAGGDHVVSSRLLVTEAHRASQRITTLEHASVTKALGQVDLVDPDAELFSDAGMLPGSSLRSLDALHVASALDLGCEVMIAYDQRVLAAAAAAGLECQSPR